MRDLYVQVVLATRFAVVLARSSVDLMAQQRTTSANDRAHYGTTFVRQRAYEAEGRSGADAANKGSKYAGRRGVCALHARNCANRSHCTSA